MAYRTKFLRALRRSEAGNVMYLTAGLLVPIMATIGSGVDLGQAFMAKARLQQACDAGVLAGRRNMAEGTWDTDAANAANKMFAFNYPTDIYGSEDVTFTPGPKGTSEVTATASAKVNTIVMRMFGKEEIPLSVSCTAKLEISNVDIMFVLDTTGSMLDTNSGDSVNKISALRTEVMSFYDTVAAAQQGDAQIRYGVMPYSSNVNVGKLVYAKNNSWISDETEIPSRVTNLGWTVSLPAYTAWTQTVAPADVSPKQTIWGKNSTTCPLTIPSPQYVDISRISTISSDGHGGAVESWNVYKYNYKWYSSSNECRLQRATGTATKTTTASLGFQNYTYKNVTYDVNDALTGAGITVAAGDLGADITATWNGCIMERDTVSFPSNSTSIPTAAYDLNIDDTPGGDELRWHAAFPQLAYPRSANPYDSQSGNPTTGVTTTNDYNSYGEGSNVSGGWAACPSEAMKLRTIPAASRSVLLNYVNGLVAIGGTYHDVGMTWGTRFISPTGMFEDENDAAPNGAPISRHIIFMTDGAMSPNFGIYGFQGQEYIQNRVGGTSTTDLKDRHNKRFLAACDAAKSRNITVWVVSFGVTLDSTMQACASGDKAYQASNKAQLHQQFQAIAQQITRLRLSE